MSTLLNPDGPPTACETFSSTAMAHGTSGVLPGMALHLLFSSPLLSKAEPETPQEKGVVGALTAPSRGTKNLSRARGDPPTCSEPLGGAATLSGALSSRAWLFSLGHPKSGDTKGIPDS